MEENAISFTRQDHIAHIILNRTGAGNCLNQQMAQELADVCLRANQEENIFVVVITGAGDTFCSGSEPAFSQHSVSGAIAGINCPVIAVINGDALGPGLELALACDIRLSSDRARFGLPQISAGLMPVDGGTQRLPRIVGKSKALELILTGEVISAQAALEIGLVSRVVPHENLAAEAQTLSESIAGKAPIALKYIKEAVNGGLELTLEQGLRLEADLYFLLHTTTDHTEGIRAFLEKRLPRFRGE